MTSGAIYVRVSTEEQANGQSLDYQLDACQTYLEGLGVDDVKVYRDAGFSAKSTNRPAFLEMMRDARQRRFQLVIVYRFDRFARNVLDSRLAKAELEAANIRLVSVTEPFDESPAGRMSGGIAEVFAEYYSTELSAKVESGLRMKAAKGLPNGLIPFGYRQSANPKAEPPLVVESEAKMVCTAYEWFTSGTTTYKMIATKFNAAGYRTRHRPTKRDPDGERIWTGDSIRSLIQNPIYKGCISYKGEVLPGKHERIVSSELWERANTVGTRLRGKATSWAPVRFYSLAGIIKCAGCGSNLQGNYTRSGKCHRYYRETAHRRGVACSKPQIAIRADKIESEVDSLVARFTMPPDVRQRVIELLGAEKSEEETEKVRAAISERLRRLRRLYAELAVEEADYEAQRRKLEAELERLSIPASKAIRATEQFDLLKAAWARATPEEKRSLGLALFEAIYVDLESMEIADVVVNPAFRPWLDQNSSL